MIKCKYCDRQFIFSFQHAKHVVGVHRNSKEALKEEAKQCVEQAKRESAIWLNPKMWL